MSATIKVIGGFAAVGFLLPLAMLAYYAVSGAGAGEAFIQVCPSCMISMALDNASTSTGVIVWLVICVSNSVLYSLPGIAIAFAMNLRRASKPQKLFDDH